MTQTVQDLVRRALALTEDERLEMAAELLASVDSPADPNWDSAWLTELDRRMEAAAQRDVPPAEWSEARKRILDRLVAR